MKKVALIMLLVFALVFSMTITAESLEGYSNSQENNINLTTIESQAVSAPVFGVDFSLCDSEQVDSYLYTIRLADNGLQLEFIELGNPELTINDIGGPRGGILLRVRYSIV